MTRKKGEMTDMDRYEEGIRQNADKYSVVGFRPGSGMETMRIFTGDQLPHAIAYAKILMKERVNRLRSAMIYALDEYNHHALVGTVDEFNPDTFKEVKVKYK